MREWSSWFGASLLGGIQVGTQALDRRLMEVRRGISSRQRERGEPLFPHCLSELECTVCCVHPVVPRSASPATQLSAAAVALCSPHSTPASPCPSMSLQLSRQRCGTPQQSQPPLLPPRPSTPRLHPPPSMLSTLWWTPPLPPRPPRPWLSHLMTRSPPLPGTDGGACMGRSSWGSSGKVLACQGNREGRTCQLASCLALGCRSRAGCSHRECSWILQI